MPPNLELIQVLFIITQVVFAFAFGACVGSLTNVLVYRLPLGLSVVSPPSRCPKCSTLLTWRENIPIFGWLLLRGKCRFCKEPISAEYPLVETFVALMFAVFYTLWYIVPPDFDWLGIPWGSIKPEWAMNGFAQTWPAFIALLTLLSCLVAMTLVDAKTFTIPLVLTWVPAIAALFLHPLGAWLNTTTLFGGWGTGLRFTARGEVWAMATPGSSGWWWIGASIGGVIGLGIANVMVAKGWLTRSFADYEEWEKGEKDKALGTGHLAQAPGEEQGDDEVPVSPSDPQHSALGTQHSSQHSSVAELWIQYPHARREMVKELAFLAPCGLLMMVGGALATKLAGPWATHPATLKAIPAVDAPLWLVALGGVLMGYLIGGGIVWIFRILGSLGFGKEAIGLGDVHLMAAVGAVLGWIDPILAFFAAAFVGIAFQVIKVVSGGRIRRAMAYGPCLAIATVLVILCKPGIEKAMTLILKAPIPIDLP